MGEDSCADCAGPHPEAGGELAGHLGVTAVLTILFVTCFMFLPFSWVKTAVQTVQGHILRLRSSHADRCAYCSTCYILYVPTVLMGEDSCADSAGPHPEAGCELAGHLWVTAEVLPEAPLVHIELPAHRTRVIRASPLCCNTKHLLLQERSTLYSLI